MDAAELVRSWFAWRKTVEFLRHDREKILGAPVRFPKDYAFVLERFEREAQARESDLRSQLRRHDVRILGEVTDRGEHFVTWRWGGQTEMLRIHEAKLRVEVQKNIDELMVKIAEERQ